jgi:hypothetical protein
VDTGHAQHASGHAERTHRAAVVRAWVAGVVTFIVVFLAVRWLMRQIFPVEGGLPADFWIYVLRVTTSLAVAMASAIAAGLLAYGRHD